MQAEGAGEAPPEAPSVKEEQPEEETDPLIYHLKANALTIAMINKMLPKGFKFDVLEVVHRQTLVHLKRTGGLANHTKV